MNTQTKEWLLNGPEYLHYSVLKYLADEDEAVLNNSYNKMLMHSGVKALKKELEDWPGKPLKRHNDATLLIHKLSFLVELGIKQDQLGNVIDRIMENSSEDGPLRVIVNIPVRFGGSGKDEWSWFMCDAPVVLYCLCKLGLQKEKVVQTGVDYLLSLVRDNGFPCAAEPKYKNFRGPGRKGDPCPYANMLMLKLMAAVPELVESKEAGIALNTVFDLWRRRKEVKPYIFGMGTGFSKLKAPFIFYDILHLINILHQFPQVLTFPEFLEIGEIIKNKSYSGRYISESVYRAWKEWDFGQKKQPSEFITFQVEKIMSTIS